MSNYVKSTNFATKDSLSSGDPLKIVKGTEINTEYDNIATAVATKADLASPTFTGTVVIATATITTAAITTATISGGTITGITDLAVADGGTGSSTAAGARTALSAAALGANSDNTALSGLTTALSVAQGGTGAATLAANNVVLGNGTSALQVVAPSTSGNVLTSNGTTWQSVTPFGQSWATATIVSGTAYTNSTNKPIMLKVDFLLNGPAATAGGTVEINSVSIGYIAASYAPATGGYNNTGSIIVPPSATYKVTTVNSSISAAWILS